MNKSTLIAAVIAVGAVLWVASGALLGEESHEESGSQTVETHAQRELQKVQVRKQVATNRIDDISVNGRTEALRAIELRVEEGGRVTEILVQEGAKVEEGQPILHIDRRDREETLAEAKALRQQRQIEYNAARELQDRGFQSEVRLAEARAMLESAQAAVKRAEISLEDTTVKAPFAGTVDSLPIELGDYLSAGDPVAHLVDLSAVKVVGFITEREIARINDSDIEGTAQFLNGQAFTGKLTHIAKTADPQTRTFRVELTIPNVSERLIAGLTARMSIPLTAAPAHLVPLSAITIDDHSNVGIKSVDENNIVSFRKVQIVGDGSPGNVWVSNLPDQFTLITVGQEFVADGQQVAPIPLNANANAPEGNNAPPYDAGSSKTDRDGAPT